MLSQSGNSASTSLHRTRSANSVKSRRKQPLQAERINPQVARTHALIAAHRAIDRSRASHSSDLARSESVLDRNTVALREEHNKSFSPASHLRRQRSTLQCQVPKLANTLQIPVQSFRTGENYQEDNGSVKLGLTGENYGAEPSSYRRLKRSGSLSTPIRLLHRPLSGTPETTISEAPTLRKVGSSIGFRSPSLKVRLKRSLNFLRHHHSIGERIITAPAKLQSSGLYHPDAVVLARNQYSDNIIQQQQSKQPSTLFSSTTKQAPKSFRKTFRSRTPHDFQNPSEVRVEAELSAKGDKISIPISLSDRVKKLFSKTKSIESFPPQQLEASRAHFNIDSTEPNTEAGFDSYLTSETKLVQAKNLGQSTDLHFGTCPDMRLLSLNASHSASCESLSLQSKSRVTSWTNSSATSSIATRDATFEPKRLSVIKEDGGPHQPSSSAGRHFGGVPIFQQPLHVPEGQTIDSQRVYSALVKRIDEEQQEIEKTQAALKEIHDAQEADNVVGHYLFSAPTIRRVDSQARSELSCIVENNSRAHNNPSSRAVVSTPPSDEDEDEVDIRKVKSTLQPIQSNFISCSDGDSSKTSSPVRQLLFTRQCGAEESGPRRPGANSEVCLNHGNHEDLIWANHNFGMSTDSIYSRTTNGGTNLDYVSPIGSTEDFGRSVNAKNSVTSLLNSTCSKTSTYGCLTSGFKSVRGLNTSIKGAQSAVSKYQIGSAELKSSRPGPLTHFREHAQVDPEDTEVGYNPENPLMRQIGFTSACTRESNKQNLLYSSLKLLPIPKPSISGLNTSSNTSLQLKQVPRNHTPAPSRNVGMKRSHSALLNQTNRTETSPLRSREASDLRQTSPCAAVQLLKVRKSHPVMSTRLNAGKENSPIAAGDSPPVSTPGRYQFRTHDQHSNKWLRKGKSTNGLRTQGRSEDHQECVPSEDNPPEKLKAKLSARLSKPFDMDIPDRNRPFDSIYLGKRKAGDGNRLSVASNGNIARRPRTYGSLGLTQCVDNGSLDEVEDCDVDTTALPAISSTEGNQRSTPSANFTLAGKRLVSSLLKSRKTQQSEARRLPSESHAFI